MPHIRPNPHSRRPVALVRSRDNLLDKLLLATVIGFPIVATLLLMDLILV